MNFLSPKKSRLDQKLRMTKGSEPRQEEKLFHSNVVTKITPRSEDSKAQKRIASSEVWQARVWHALRHLDDRSVLNQSPLARLSYIERLANKEFRGNILVRGLALREVLVDCIDRIIEQGDSERGLHNTCEFLRLVKEGMSLTAIGKTLGVSREHVTRVYKRKAVELLTEIFLSTIRDGRCA
jgi:hypothetical protein